MYFFLIYLINISFIFALFTYLYYFCFLYGICIKFFYNIYNTNFKYLYIYIKNMKENINTEEEKNDIYTESIEDKKKI